MADTQVPTFETVWASLQETDRLLKESIKENELRKKETDRRMKETDRLIGKLTNRFGDMVEHLVVPGIKEKFNELNFTFDQVAKNVEISDPSGKCIVEIDILLENGDTVIVVEVKATPVQRDVDDHVGRMEILRRRADTKNDKRKYQGAIAGAVMQNEVRNYAHKTGFYVLEQTGDTMRINIPEGFKAREW